MTSPVSCFHPGSVWLGVAVLFGLGVLPAQGEVLSIQSSSPLSGGEAGVPYSAQLSATGGSPPYSWSVAGGSLPPGLEISSAGLVSGTPQQSGVFGFVARVSDSANGSADKTLSLKVAPRSLVVTTTGPLPAATVGVAYSAAVQAAGGTGSYTWSLSGGSLPPGIGLDSGGALTGTPSASGSFGFTVKVTDSQAVVAYQAVGLTVQPAPAPSPLMVLAAALPEVSVGAAYSARFQVSGGTPPYTWSYSGSLPPGVAFSSSGLSGTPTAAGSFSFTVSVTDQQGGAASQVFSVTVQAPPPAAIQILSGSQLPGGAEGKTYLYSFGASGGVGPYRWSLDPSHGEIPPGLSLTTDGLLTGTAARAGAFSFTVVVTDSNGKTLQEEVQIQIQAAQRSSLQISDSGLQFKATVKGGAPALQSFVVTSGTSTPITFSVPTSPAPWLQVSPSGGTTPAIIVVRADQSGLGAGSYSTSLEVLGNDSDVPVTLAATLQVEDAGGPQLAVSPGLIEFQSLAASTTDLTSTLLVKNLGGGTIQAKVKGNTPWLRVSGSDSVVQAGGGQLQVSVDQRGLDAGYYYGTIAITSSSGKVEVPVTLFRPRDATMRLEPYGLYLRAKRGEGVAAPKPALWLSTTDPGPRTWTAEVRDGKSWMTLDETSGTVSSDLPARVPITLSVQQLAIGTYFGRLHFDIPGVLDSPQETVVVLDVKDPKDPDLIGLDPAGLVFIVTAEQPVPEHQRIGVYAGGATPLSFQASPSTLDQGGWLSIDASGGTSTASQPAFIDVSVNPSTLGRGTYRGRIHVGTAAGSVQGVNVTLIVQPDKAANSAAAQRHGLNSSRIKGAVCTPKRLVPADVGLVSNFNSPVAWPAPLRVQVSDDCGNSVLQGQVTVSFSNGDPPIVLKPSSDKPGVYTGTWIPQQSSSKVTLTIQATVPGLETGVVETIGAITTNKSPILARNGTLHNLNPQRGAPLAPGTVAQIYGSNMAIAPAAPDRTPLPAELGGTSVIVGGMEAPLYYTSPTQITAQIPFELAPGRPYQILISANGALTLPDTIQLVPAQPGVAAFPDGKVIAQHLDGSLVTKDTPATAGEILVIYLAGMGAAVVPVASGTPSPSDPLPRVSQDAALRLGGKTADVLYAGLTPGSVGVYQINFRVPADIASGDQELVVTQGNVEANRTILPVR